MWCRAQLRLPIAHTQPLPGSPVCSAPLNSAQNGIALPRESRTRSNRGNLGSMGGLWSVTFSASPNSFACARKRRAEGPGAAALRWEGTAAPPRPSAARPFPRTLCRSTPRRRQTRRPSARRSARLRGAGRRLSGRLSGRGARRRRRRGDGAAGRTADALPRPQLVCAPPGAARVSGEPEGPPCAPNQLGSYGRGAGQRSQGRLGPNWPGQRQPAAVARSRSSAPAAAGARMALTDVLPQRRYQLLRLVLLRTGGGNVSPSGRSGGGREHTGDGSWSKRSVP